MRTGWGRAGYTLLRCADVLIGLAAFGSAVRAQSGAVPPANTAGAIAPGSTVRFLVPAADSTGAPRAIDPAQIPSLRRSIALDLHDVDRTQALADVGRAAGLNFVYASDLIPARGSLSLTSSAIPVSAALDSILEGIPVDVLVDPNGTIVLASRAANIDVQLTDQTSGLPIEGALVSILADDGTTVAQGITDPHGMRRMTTGAEGRYRVRVRRIGYLPFTSEPVTAGAGATTRVPLTILSVPISLPAVTAAAKPKDCREGQAAQLTSLELWDQVRIVLETSELTRADTSVHMLSRNFNRFTSRWGDLEGLAAASQSLGSDQPYFARPAADLSAHGYVTGDAQGMRTFDGPDATVLLSPEFENDHCFNVIAGAGPTSGLIGLSFTPVASRAAADINGVLWVAPPTARLEYLDYRYVNVKLPVSADLAGGRIIFERLPHGEWIVQSWVIHAPDIEYVKVSGDELAGYVDIGGLAEPVVATTPTPGACPDSTRPLTVTVRDTTGALVPAGERTGGLAGAMVEVNWFGSVASPDSARTATGPPQVGETDRQGVARMCLLQHSGRPIVIAYASRATSATVPLPTDKAGPLAVILGVNGPEWHMLDAVPPPAGSSHIELHVRDADGTPIEGATVEVNGWEYTSESTNGSGRLSLGSLPAGTAILDVWRAGYARQRLAIDLASKRTRTVEIRLVAQDRK